MENSKANESAAEPPLDCRVGRTISGYEIEHMFWLAARDIVFFHTWNGETWDGGWQVAILCNDTFFYAAADAEALAPGEESALREFYERHGWAGVVAWCAHKRGKEPLPELQDDAYRAALAELVPNAQVTGAAPTGDSKSDER